MWLRKSVFPPAFRKRIKLKRKRPGASDGMSEADFRADNERLRCEVAEATMVNEFLSKATVFFVFEATRAEKFELMQPEQGQLQHQTHGTAVKSVSAWILQRGPMRSRNGYPEKMMVQHFTMMSTARFIRFGKTLMRFMVLCGSPQNLPSATAFRSTVRLWRSGCA